MSQTSQNEAEKPADLNVIKSDPSVSIQFPDPIFKQ